MMTSLSRAKRCGMAHGVSHIVGAKPDPSDEFISLCRQAPLSHSSRHGHSNPIDRLLPARTGTILHGALLNFFFIFIIPLRPKRHQSQRFSLQPNESWTDSSNSNNIQVFNVQIQFSFLMTLKFWTERKVVFLICFVSWNTLHWNFFWEVLNYCKIVKWKSVICINHVHN